MAKKKSAKRGKANGSVTPRKKSAKNSLVGNINRRKKAGVSRTKKDSTISPAAYAAMKQGWPKKEAE